jgi:hypothetical protein
VPLHLRSLTLRTCRRQRSGDVFVRRGAWPDAPLPIPPLRAGSGLTADFLTSSCLLQADSQERLTPVTTRKCKTVQPEWQLMVRVIAFA